MKCGYQVRYSNGTAWVCDTPPSVMVGSECHACGHRNEHYVCSEHYAELREAGRWQCKKCGSFQMQLSEPVAL